MKNILYSILGILIPFFGTSLGSSLVFFMKKDMKSNIKKLIIGFASGVMISASIWSLILPAIEMAESQGKVSWIPATVGFALGVFFLIIINNLAEKIENKNCGKKMNMLLFSVTLHNIPEGMAVGVGFAGFLAGNTGISFMEAFILAVGIAIQNIPERCNNFYAIKNEGYKQKKSIFIRCFIRNC